MASSKSAVRADVRKSGRPPIVSLKDVRLQDGPVMLFDGVDLTLESRSRACLVGRNGAGKSTLMRLIAGEIDADAGQRFVQPGLRSVFVPQEPQIGGDTVRDHAVSGGAAGYQADAALEIFGLDPMKPSVGLSGGEIRRAALAKAFAEAPDLILLDEPTNHLDILAIETLEAEIARSRSAALIVSHDRAFLQRVTNRCFWLAHRRVRSLEEGFGAFEPWSRKVEAEEAEGLRRLEKAIERETYTFYRSITAQRTRNEGRARALEAMRATRASLMRDQSRALELTIEDGGTSGRLVAEVKEVSKTFAGRPIFSSFSTRIVRGDRIAVVGPNGAGKTTLVKLLLGEIPPDAGSVRLGSNLETVYLDQARADLRGEATLWEALTPNGGDSVLVRGRSVHVAAYARDFLFKDSQLRQPVSTLSGGERNRLLLARALSRPANLLVLDEPTNDLDMETLDLLEDVLADYEGTLLLVSHDRDFIDRLATSTIALDGRGRVVETPGGWSDFMAQNPGFLEGTDLGAPPGRTGSEPGLAPRWSDAPPAAPAGAAATDKKGIKLSFKDQRRLEEAERRITEIPREIADLEAGLADPALFGRDPARFSALTRQIDARRDELARAEDDWLALEEKRSPPR